MRIERKEPNVNLPSNEDILFVLGADDPEMRRIKEVLSEEGLPFTAATVDGIDVHPGNAYLADTTEEIAATSNIIIIEAEIEGIIPKIRIDHHRESDPGFHMGAEKSWEASSLGQLHTLLNIEPTEKDLLLAAMDHHFAGAVRGEVPGVDSKKVLDLKIAEIASGNNTTNTIVQRVIEKYKVALTGILKSLNPSEPRLLNLAGLQVVDYTDVHLGAGYNTEVLGAETAATVLGVSCLMKLKDTPEGDDKISVDSAPPELVKYFIGYYSKELGLTRVYGVPARGYAGGYIAS